MKKLELEALYRVFRDPKIIQALNARIHHEAQKLSKPLYIMEVCGGHTHAIMKYALKSLLPQNIHFVHGPGCPVCVMPKERIDMAIALANMPDTILATLGDMIRVPASYSSLAKERAKGCDIRALYSPMDVLTIAQQNPTKKVVFFAIGFETTTPMSAALLDAVVKNNIQNVTILSNHVLVPPAVKAIMHSGNTPINAFIMPSHVSVITGAKTYTPLSQKYKIPMVVAGFEAVDIMQSILMLIRQAIDGTYDTQIQYTRAVTYEGNTKAQKLIDTYFTPCETFKWRGLGDIAHSALAIKSSFKHLDALYVYRDVLQNIQSTPDHSACKCADILSGRALPTQCTLFGTVCTPQNPIGSCMVSDEGACSAYYLYPNDL